MVTPYPSERREDYYTFPAVGQTVRIKGLVSTTYLRRGETMVIRWTPFWEEFIVKNYITILSTVEEPAATEFFPTMAEVWKLIEQGSTTLPGEKILGMRVAGNKIHLRVGVSMEFSREFAVTWPELEDLILEATDLRDQTREYAEDAEGNLAAGVQVLKDQLVAYNGIAVVAAERSLTAAEDAADAAARAEATVQEGADQAVSDAVAGLELEARSTYEAQEVPDTAWAHITENGTRLPLGYSPDGHLDAHARTTFREDVMGVTEHAGDPGDAYVMTTEDGKLLMSFRQDGTVTIPGLDGESSGVGPGISVREKYRHTDGTLAPVMADTTQIAGWGSSSMLGMAPEITAALDGLPATYTNYAQGGEFIEHNAARMGVEPAIIDPVTVPESGAVTVTSPNLPFNTFMLPYTGHLGGVHGTLAPVSGSFHFTRTASGDVLTLAAPTEFIPDIDPHLMERTQILQLGKNNLWQGDAVSNVSRLTDKIIQSLRPLHMRVLLLGHHWNRGYDPGHATHLRVSGMSEHMRKIAGEDCFIDVHAITTGQEIWERTGLTPTAQDLADQEAGILPASLAADNKHFNASMEVALAQIIRERIDYLGWY